MPNPNPNLPLAVRLAPDVRAALARLAERENSSLSATAHRAIAEQLRAEGVLPDVHQPAAQSGVVVSLRAETGD